MSPTEKQIDFATSIAEWLGIDLPEKFSRDAYWKFISENEDEFYAVKNRFRYAEMGGDTFSLNHSYVVGDRFCGDQTLNKNPWT